MMAAAIVAQALDWVTFIIGVSIVGIAAEMNPLARLAYAIGGPLGDGIYKLVMVLAALWLCHWVGREAGRNIGRVGYGIVIVVGLLGAGMNTLAILMSGGL